VYLIAFCEGLVSNSKVSTSTAVGTLAVYLLNALLIHSSNAGVA
jgi:hypothetical protein